MLLSLEAIRILPIFLMILMEGTYTINHICSQSIPKSYLFVTVRSPIARPSNPGSPPMYVDEQDFSIVVYDR